MPFLNQGQRRHVRERAASTPEPGARRPPRARPQPSTMACASAGETPRRTGRSAIRAPSRRRATSAGNRSAGERSPRSGDQAAPAPRGRTDRGRVPPPIVVTGLKLRSTNRSPPRATTGDSRASRARTASPWPWSIGTRGAAAPSPPSRPQARPSPGSARPGGRPCPAAIPAGHRGPGRRPGCLGSHGEVAPPDARPIDTDESDRRARARLAPLHRGAKALDRSDAPLGAVRQEPDRPRPPSRCPTMRCR